MIRILFMGSPASVDNAEWTFTDAGGAGLLQAALILAWNPAASYQPDPDLADVNALIQVYGAANVEIVSNDFTDTDSPGSLD
jgi:hypothetical protein